MPKAKSGDKVKVHYTGTLNGGEQFDSSRDAEPLEFILGTNQVIPGFENAVIGLEIGETRKVSIEPKEAYGEKRDDLIIEVGHDLFKVDEPVAGQVYEMTLKDNQNTPVLITEVREDSVVLDANHPLAGEILVFDIKLMEIVG